MKDFIVYKADGIIQRTGNCSDEDFDLQAGLGEFVIEGEANDDEQMIVNGVVVDKPPVPPALFDIVAARLIKSAQISAACEQFIVAGYSSDALGTAHLYPAKDRDQSNMIASVTDSYNPTNTLLWQTPFWCRDANGDWAYKMHTRTQIQKAGSDGKANIVTQLIKNATLQAQINLANTQAALDIITW